MMKCIVHYYEMGIKAIREPSKKEDKISYALLKNQTIAQANKLKQMKFQDPKQTKQELQAFFSEFSDEITTAFKKLMDK